MTTEVKKSQRFFKRWATTIAFVLLVIAQVVTFSRGSTQQDRIETLTRQNAAQIDSNAKSYCLNRRDTRDSLRGIFSAILENFDQNDQTVKSVLTLIQKDYPPIICPETDK